MLVLCLFGASCAEPGPRGDGISEVTVAGDNPIAWSGTCLYSVQTRWATRLPHILRLDDNLSDRALVISGSKKWTAGRLEFRSGGGPGILGLAFQGSVVEGSLLGSLEVLRAGDSTFFAARGFLAARDTAPLTAACRLGPLDR